MITLRMRPRFTMLVACSLPDTLSRLHEKLESADTPCLGAFFDNHAVLKIPPTAQHYWSPQLTLDFEVHASGTLVRGLFGPRPAVWTMFMAFYAMLAFAGMIGSVFGLSQWMLDQPAPALWALPTALLLMTVIYGVALAGQHLGGPQMQTLQGVLRDALSGCK